MNSATEDLDALLAELERTSHDLHELDGGVLAQLRQRRDDTIREARRSGATWEQIGQSLGIKKQTAWERFRALEDED